MPDIFHQGDLQSGIALAIQNQKAVLCFIHDDTDTSSEWNATLTDSSLSEPLLRRAVAIKLKAGSVEAAFLDPICKIRNVPAVAVIKNGAVQLNITAVEQSSEGMRDEIARILALEFSSGTPASRAWPPAGATSDPSARPEQPHTTENTGPSPTSPSEDSSVGYIDLPSSAGQPRLPNNAYEAFREYTQTLKDAGRPPQKIFEAQVAVLSRLPIFKDEVHRLRSLNPGKQPTLSDTARERLMLRLPAAAIKAQMKAQSAATTSTAQSSVASPAASPLPQSSQPTPPSASSSQPPTADSAPPPSYESLSASQRAQQATYRQQQKEREQKARDERDRIKAQIKADREERRRREKIQKENDTAATNTSSNATTSQSDPATVKFASNIIRVQVRTFSGAALLRNAFPPTASIAADIRPWLDTELPSHVEGGVPPYDFKLILTPQPNRKIEAAEEAFSLSDLGIRGSCTFVIAPVKGYVESYTGGGGGGVVGSVVSGGYGLVSGAVGGLFGGVRSLMGYGSSGGAPQAQHQESPGMAGAGQGEGRSMRVRTLADQRAEQQGNQFYNGNTLNFEPNRDDDKKQD